MHKKHQRRENSKVLKGELSCLYATHRQDLYTCEVSSIYSKWFSSYRADTKMFMDGWTDGRQAHRYIAQTFRSGDKKGHNPVNV